MDTSGPYALVKARTIFPESAHPHSWGGLMTELFNGRETDITGNYNSLLFEWQLLKLNPRLSRGSVRRLPWLLPVPLLWHLPRPFLEHGMMNTIWVYGDIVCLLFCLSLAIKRWEPIIFRDACSRVWLYVPGIKNWLRAFCLKIIIVRL